VTVLNKLMSVVTFLKKNPEVSITRLLKAEDWPEKPETEPNPYTDEELRAMMEAATPDERLLIRFFLGTGMRDQEVAHTELSDIKDTYIQVQPKPKYGWSPKTAAGTRQIPLGDGLLADCEIIAPAASSSRIQPLEDLKDTFSALFRESQRGRPSKEQAATASGTPLPQSKSERGAGPP